MHSTEQPHISGSPKPQLRSTTAILTVTAISLTGFLLLSVAAFHSGDILPRVLYTYDEADYMYAAEKGFSANYFDKGAISLFSFLSMGSKAGFNKSEWSKISKYIRSSSDISFYRHFHGPLYFYWLAATKKVGLSKEAHVRYATFLLMLLSSLALAWFIIALFPLNGPWTALTISLGFMVGPSMILTGNHITPHPLYLFFSILCLGWLALYRKTKLPRYWYASTAASGVAFITLEYAIFLIVTLLVTLWIDRKELAGGGKIRLALSTIGCFLLPTVIVWPSGIFKLTIVKNYLFYAYFTIIRGSSYSSLSPLEVWLMRLGESPAELIVFMAAAAAIPFVVKRHRFLLPCAVYALCILLTTVRNTSTFPQYIASAIPALYFVAAGVLAHFLSGGKSPYRKATAIAIVAIFIMNFSVYFSHTVKGSLQPMPYTVTRLDDLREAFRQKQTVFLNRDYLTTLHYYFPGVDFHPYTPGRDSIADILQQISVQINKTNAPAWLFFDRVDTAMVQQIGSIFAIERTGSFYFSDAVPNATGFYLARKNTES